ncbi:uncharacterized transmembrane protein DDB_G0289901-like isoform X2 [Ruditapes philippinarum]|uniref:uncharacterized transmembrane protein DDB_G0289901-like isoform X2 n=1 Tax=Ruditapes philippinarum TaxID=129788 RepID=UPI00295B5119|nr:uncharacterized transmembrane protein DDB_G0289901-like isoform X2 [Ruditapes philippinarum]
MEKLLLTFIGIVFLSVIIDAQDIGRMRRLMLLRQRELALRRGGFPFGITGVGGPGIPPPGGSGNIFGQQPTQVFPNVPSVVQIPSVTPTAQGQPGDSQVGAGQMGGQSSTMGGQVSGQMGGAMGGQMGGAMGGPMGGAMGGPMGGQVPGSMSGSFGGTMTGSMGGSMSGPMGGSMSGPMGGSMGGTMGGAMGGQMVGGPMGRQVSGQMGSSIGGAMGGPMAGRPMGGAIGGPFGMPMGGPMRGPMTGPMRGPGMGPFRGPIGGSVGSPFGSQFTGPTFSFSQPSGGQFSTGSQTQGQEGSAIFPSQATQGPVIRQRGPGFTTESGFPPGLDMSGSSTVGIPAFPNGPALPFPAGAPGFGQSDPFMFPAGGFQTDVLSGTDLQASRFPGFPASSFGQRFGVNVETSSVPGFDATPTRRQSNGINSIGSESISDGSSFRPATFGPTIDASSAGQSGQSVGGSRSEGQVTQSFGFVGPSNNAGAGPAFNTDTQSSQNFNIQFQPLQPGPVPQIPALQPNQGQIGVGGTVVQTNAGQGNGFTNQDNVQFGSSSQSFQTSGSSQGGLQFGGSSQGGFQTGDAGQNSQFIVSDGPTVVETRTNQQNGGMTFGSNSQSSNNAATTVSERTVETGGATGNAEFRLVEVGNILGDKGFVNNDAGSSRVVVTETISTNQGADFQPVGDINTAFRSFESVAGSNNVVDLSLEPTLSMTGNTVTTSDATGSTTETNTSETRSIMSVQDGPFAASLNQNQDFSFFMTDNTNEAPNEMPPITFNAPPPPVVGPEGPSILTFAVDGMANTGNEMPTISSKQEFSSSSNSFTIAPGGETVLGPDQSGASTIVEEAKPLSALP